MKHITYTLAFIACYALGVLIGSLLTAFQAAKSLLLMPIAVLIATKVSLDTKLGRHS
jgi:hypothetical protein